MRVLVCGGRDYADKEYVYGLLDKVHGRYGVDIVIEGGARGADALARQWAHDRRLLSHTVHADWKRHGKRAGPIRNQRMLVEGNPDLVIAFPGGRGTADMVRRASDAEIRVIEVLE